MSSPADLDRDYVLGTHDEEVRRLGLQHEAWREVVLDCWARAGIGPGMDVLDVGAGPGHAALDLAEIVGPGGTVTAVERSSRFASAGILAAEVRAVGNLSYRELDLMLDPLPEGPYDAAWCRWVCSFLPDPERLVAELARVVRPHGIAVFHEYVDYGSWRYSPHLPLLDEFVAHVMRSWRETGGEPDVAMSIPPLLERHGFTVVSATPHAFCVRPGHPLWSWISTFVKSNCDRLVELGTCEPAWVAAVRQELTTAERDPSTILLTPMVLELMAERVEDPLTPLPRPPKIIAH